MINNGTYYLSAEVIKAIDEGYSIPFIFVDGHIFCEHDTEIVYPIKDVKKIPVPDLINQIVLYRIETKDGIRGFAIAEWIDDVQLIF